MARKTEEILGCDSCPWKGTTPIVPWEGDFENAKLVVIGQNPGSEELKKLRPFVGPCSFFFDELERITGIRREECYITNVVKCGGDNPPDTVVVSCRKQWIEEWDGIIRSDKKIVILGDYGKNVLGLSNLKVSQATVLGNAVVLQLYHPAWALYSGKRAAYVEDMRLINNLLRVQNPPPELVVEIPTTPSRAQELLKEIIDGDGAFAFDLETSGLNPHFPGSRIISISLYDGVRVVVLDFDKFPIDLFTEGLRKLFLSPRRKIAHNLKFDALWLQVHLGVNPTLPIFDTLVAEHVLGQGSGHTLGLNQLVFRYIPEYFRYSAEVDFESKTGVEKHFLLKKNAYDSFLAYHLACVQEGRLNENNQGVLFFAVLMPALRALVGVEATGFKVDSDALSRVRGALNFELAAIEEKLMERCVELGLDKKEFSLNSPYFLRKLFFDKLGLKVVATTPKGSPSLNVDALTVYAEKGQEEAVELVKYRGISKLLSTYYDRYLADIDSNGFLYPSYSMTSTATGRLSSFSPNIQNVPGDVRKVFVSRFPGGKIVEFDFKQIEMRVMAIESNDEELIEIFKNHQDPHAAVASKIFGLPLEEIINNRDDLRNRAKAVNFGILYGMGVPGLVMSTKMPYNEAQAFFDAYLNRFKGLARWQQMQKQVASAGQPIRSLLNRIWDFSRLRGEDVMTRCLNYPIQSLASDINLYVLGISYEVMEDLNMKSKIVATVHDSIVIDAYPDEVDDVVTLVKTVVAGLPRVFKWMSVPMEVSVGIGNNWGNLEEV